MNLPHRASAADPSLVADLVAANHILFRHGIVDGFGHVSVRHDRDPERFLLARNMAPALVTTEDVMAFAHDGTALDGDERPAYNERFIHGAIYRARPDVGAVVHSHAASLIPFGVVSNVPLRPVYHMSSFLGGPVPVFEIRDAAGPDNDMLVRSDALGAALAASLGDHVAVLMRGHGATIVGANVRQAVFRAIYTEQNALLQAQATHLGAVTYLSELEAARSAETNAGQVERAWSLWKREV
ncbi:MAG TPA: class II aldolase/adducin family protein [Candidatus Elarobacter sp.]